MQYYLVGGAVRDKLLGLAIREHDYVVIGETPESMLNKGFKQVGKDFPVFLHPKTQEEYALARKERKTDVGYHGFSMNVDQSISLEEDLLRRDLTINAIAQDSAGNIIDPFNGQADLKQKILKHVSNAFIEDPLRVLRVARFQAYLPEFSIHSSTQALLKTICQTPNEIKSLPTERIWLEINKAAKHPAFYLFWETLNNCDALTALNISLNDQFIQDLKQSNLSGVERLLSTFWHQEDLSGFTSLQPPTLIGDGIRLISSQKDILLSYQQYSEIEILHTCQRLDPYRRYERAYCFIDSMPTQYHTQKAFWKNLCQSLHNMDIQAIIKNSAPQKRQQLIEDARIEIIRHLRGNE